MKKALAPLVLFAAALIFAVSAFALSSFRNTSHFYRPRTRVGYRDLIKYLGSFSGKTFSEKVESWAFSVGVTKSEIKDLRDGLIDRIR